MIHRHSVKFLSQQAHGFGDHLDQVKNQEQTSVPWRNTTFKICFQNGILENLDVPATVKSETLRALRLSTW